MSFAINASDSSGQLDNSNASACPDPPPPRAKGLVPRQCVVPGWW